MDPAVSLPDAFATGFGLCGALIVAIGAQNAFVLRQGLRRAHVGPVVALCASADAALLAAGSWGLGAATAALPSLARWMAAAGAAFLAAYGALALRRAAAPRDARRLDAAAADGAAPRSLRATLAVAAGFTFLNPHVYLDTVVLAGSVGARLAPDARAAFVAGGACASVAWFSALGWGAGRLAPVFRSPRAWRVLDAGVGATMLALAAALAVQAMPDS
ncbi:MAG: LysE/ArgO family amino acid transporter [Burkholderiales bacterium]